jgi:hypothetical protein
MTRIIVDEVLRSKLHNFAQPLELCDASGRILARLIPQIDAPQFVPREPSISEEELQRREQSKKWHTTAEVLAHLKRLEKELENS